MYPKYQRGLSLALALAVSVTMLTSAQATDKVVVINSPTNPVPITNSGTTAPVPLLIRDAENPARTGFRDVFSCRIPDGRASCTDQRGPAFFDPDLGRKVVIVETISARVVTPVGQKVGDLTATIGGNVQIPLSFQGNIGGFDYYAALIAVRLYADGLFYRSDPQIQQFTAFRGAGSGEVLVDVEVYGHLLSK